MKLLVATDAHIYITPDGKHWTPAIYNYDFWKRYLKVFDELKIVARVKKINESSSNLLLVDGPGVEIYPITFYQGPAELLRHYLKIKKELKNVESDCDAALFRMPSQTAYMAYKSVKRKLPIAGEIVYDPTDDLKDNSSLIKKIINKKISKQLKKFCIEANGVSYVTKNTIQKNYPSKSRLKGESKYYFESYYSTITLDKEKYSGPRDYRKNKSFVLCMSDVSMNSYRKGEKTLIKVLRKILDKGYNVSAVIIGDGAKRKEFEEYAKEFDLEKKVVFLGRLASADEVRKVLLKSDVFVFPTKAEGLPRGILEAMAVGMPVLSTPVGGIPEIIDRKYLFDSDDVESFSNMLCYLIENPNELNEISKKNYLRSLEFSNDKLQQKRNKFYSKLKDIV